MSRFGAGVFDWNNGNRGKAQRLGSVLESVESRGGSGRLVGRHGPEERNVGQLISPPSALARLFKVVVEKFFDTSIRNERSGPQSLVQTSE